MRAAWQSGKKGLAPHTLIFTLPAPGPIFENMCSMSCARIAGSLPFDPKAMSHFCFVSFPPSPSPATHRQYTTDARFDLQSYYGLGVGVFLPEFLSLHIVT